MEVNLCQEESHSCVLEGVECPSKGYLEEQGRNLHSPCSDWQAEGLLLWKSTGGKGKCLIEKTAKFSNTVTPCPNNKKQFRAIEKIIGMKTECIVFCFSKPPGTFYWIPVFCKCLDFCVWRLLISSLAPDGASEWGFKPAHAKSR